MRLLGPVGAGPSRDQVAPPPGRVATAVLAQLALANGRFVTTDVLTDGTWDTPPSSARNALQVAVSKLRGLYGPELIESGPTGYRLRETLVRVDWHEANAQARQGAVAFERGCPGEALEAAESALGLYAGEPLSGWVGLPADAARQRAEDLLMTLRLLQARCHQVIGGVDRAVELLTELSSTAAFHEPVHESLMEALAAAGRPAEALQVYERLRRRLADDLGIDPSPSVQALFTRLLNGDVTRPPARVLPRKAGSARLPTPFFNTPLVGRETELKELADILETRATRLVTVTGAGGSGKTRLAAGVAAQVGEENHDVHFVSLETATSAESMWAAIAVVLGVPAEARIPPGLFAHVFNARALVVLDNLEQISAAGDVVSELLEVAPGISILATSRLPLHVPGEREYALAPLDLPETDTLAAASASASVQLFVRHAQLVRRDFVLSDDNAAAVTEICRRLDGLPLALELAAARVKLMSPAALLARLGTALDFKSSGGRRPERHQTLRQAIGWSYELLSPESQRLLRILSQFPGGAAIEALEDVVGRLPFDTEPLKQLEQLVDASLVFSEINTREPRFRLLNTIQAFAGGELTGMRELGSTRIAVLGWAHTLVGDPDRLHIGDPFARHRLGMEHEYDNLRHLIDWRAEEATPPLGIDVLSAFVDTAIGVATLSQRLGLYGDGAELLQRVVQIATSHRMPAAAFKGLVCLAELQRHAGNLASAAEHIEAALQSIGGAPSPAEGPVRAVSQLRLWALSERAAIRGGLGDLAGARADFDEVLDPSTPLEPYARITIQLEFATLLALQGHPEEALELESAAGDFASRLGFAYLASSARHNAACSLRELGRPEEAEQQMRALLPTLFAEKNAAHSLAAAEDYALVLLDLGRFEDAAIIYGAADATREAEGSSLTPSQVKERMDLEASARTSLGQRWEERSSEGARLTIEAAFGQVALG